MKLFFDVVERSHANLHLIAIQSTSHNACNFGTKTALEALTSTSRESTKENLYRELGLGSLKVLRVIN